MSQVLIPKAEGTAGQGGPAINPRPAWWLWNGRVTIRCECGEIMGIDHDIDAEGNVSPSLLHSETDPGGCGWHVFARLDKWKPGQ